MADSQRVNVKLNGVDVQTVVQLAHDIDTDAGRAGELAQYARGCRVRWVNGFNSQAYTRDVPSFGMDEPAWLGGTNVAMAASEAVLGAIGGCISVGFVANAALRGVQINELEVAVEGTIDIPSFLGLGDGSSGYKEINITIYADCDTEDDALLEEIAFRAFDLSPVVNTVRNPVEMKYVLKKMN